MVLVKDGWLRGGEGEQGWFVVTLMREQLEKDGRKTISESEGQCKAGRIHDLGLPMDAKDCWSGDTQGKEQKSSGLLFRDAQNRDCEELHLPVMIRCGVGL